MTIDWNSFTAETSFAGGVLIGLAALILMTTQGRVMGLSGILMGLLRGYKEAQLWRVLFLVGTITAPVLYILFYSSTLETNFISKDIMLWSGAILVGFGSALGSGCTSGHGICGLARLQWRSLVAVPCFMASAMITTWFILHFYD